MKRDTIKTNRDERKSSKGVCYRRVRKLETKLYIRNLIKRINI